jgi:hypothetical protein
MIARNRIWEELKQTKANIVGLQRYTDRNRKRLRQFNSLIVVFAFAGALGGFFTHWIVLIGFSLVAGVTILKSLLPNLIQSEQELYELDRLIDFYTKYLNDLESLWYKYTNEIIDEKVMIGCLFEMKKDECDRHSLLNQGIRSISRTEQEDIDKECSEYINRVYFLKSGKNITTTINNQL